MSAHRSLLLLALTILLLFSASRASADERPIVWCVGDSVAHQLCAGLEAIGHGEHWALVNHGQGTETTITGIPRLLERVTTEPTPDVVIVQYGSGDILLGTLMEEPGYTAPEIYERLEVVESILTWMGVDMVWTTTPVRHRSRRFEFPWVVDYFDGHHELNRLIRRLNIRTPGEQFVDFAHPHRLWVEQQLAPRLAREVMRRLRKRGFRGPAAGYR